MIQLGIIDPDVPPSAVARYLETVEQLTGLDWGGKLRGEENNSWVELEPSRPPPEMSVRQVQTRLRDLSFFPGATIDGICGYRTTAAIRLFQEVVRWQDSSIGVPDGIAGPKTLRHLAGWWQRRQRADWESVLSDWRNGANGSATREYRHWLTFLERTKQHYLATPNAFLEQVNAFSGETDTRKVANWDFDRRHIHLIGIRRMNREVQDGSERRFNDVITLLLKGLVFKFQGSTDPGASSHPSGPPFLVQGQHDYHFGWHLISKRHKSHQGLKPLHHSTSGVLVVRSNDFVLADSDLTRRGLETNGTINVHWGGAGGLERTVGSWSEGCQVITGAGYINHLGKRIDCRSFAAFSSGDLGPGRTRGAYNLLSDLVAALSSESRGAVEYTLLQEDDLALSPEVNASVDEARNLAKQSA